MKKLVGTVVKKLIDVIDVIIIIIILGFIISRFIGGDFIAPEGIWICEELGIIVDFDDKLDKNSSIEVRGTITIGGEVKEIVFFNSYMGDCNFYPIEDEGKSEEEKNFFFVGGITNKGKDKMIFYSGNEKYIFVRQE